MADKVSDWLKILAAYLSWYFPQELVEKESEY